MGTKLLLLDFVLLLAQMASAGTCKLDAHTAASDAAEVSTTMKCIIDFAVQSQPLISPVADSKKKRVSFSCSCNCLGAEGAQSEAAAQEQH